MTDAKERDVLNLFAEKVADEKNKGRSLVFVDDKLLEWVDEQVKARKYRSRSQTLECALNEFKERRKNKDLRVVSRDLPSDLSQINDLPNWYDVDEDDRASAIDYLCALNEAALGFFLNKSFGADLRGKIAFIEKRMKDGSLTAIQLVAFKRVLAELTGENE